MQEIVESDRIVGWYQQIIICDIFRDLERRDSLRPILPHEFLSTVEHIEQMHFIWYFDAKNYRVEFVIRVDISLLDDIRTAIEDTFEEVAEFATSRLLDRCTDGPATAKYAQIGEDVLDLFGHFGLGLVVWFHVTV